MRKLWLLLWLFLASPALAQGPPTGPPYVFTCNQSSAYSWGGTAATSQLQAGVAGKGIYICGWHGSTLSTSAGATTFQLTFSNATTNSTCSTNVPSTVLTPLNGVTSTAPSVDHPGTGMLSVPQVASTSSPSSLCINVGGVSNLQFLLYFGQY
jgi:hypothetical protein